MLKLTQNRDTNFMYSVPKEDCVGKNGGSFLKNYTLNLNSQINVVNLLYNEQIITQVRLSNAEMHFFSILYEAFPEYVADKDIHLSSASIRKHILPGLRRKMLSFAPHLHLLRLKEIGYMLVPIHA